MYDEETINIFLDCLKEVVVEAIKEPGKRLGEFGGRQILDT